MFAVNENLAIFRVVQANDQLQYGALARAIDANYDLPVSNATQCLLSNPN